MELTKETHLIDREVYWINYYKGIDKDNMLNMTHNAGNIIGAEVINPYKKLADVTELLDIDKTTANKLIHEGKIKAIKIGKQWRISPEEFERLKKEGV